MLQNGNTKQLLETLLPEIEAKILNDWAATGKKHDYFIYTNNVAYDLAQHGIVLKQHELEIVAKHLYTLSVQRPRLDIDVETGLSNYIAEVDLTWRTFNRLIDMVEMARNKHDVNRLTRIAILSKNIRTFKVELNDVGANFFVTLFDQKVSGNLISSIAIYGSMAKTVDNTKEVCHTNYLCICEELIYDTPIVEFSSMLIILNRLLTDWSPLSRQEFPLLLKGHDLVISDHTYRDSLVSKITKRLRELYADRFTSN